MLWNNLLVCIDCFNFKLLDLKLLKVCSSNLTVNFFDFIKNLAQIINNFSKVQQNKKIKIKINKMLYILHVRFLEMNKCLGKV